jgi:hypothetical protein
VTDTHWQPPQQGSPAAQGWMPNQPGQQAPSPEVPKRRGRSRMAVIVGGTAVVCALLGAVAGSITGVVVARDDKTAAAPAETPPTPAPQLVEQQTRDLCTRFVAAYAILPTENQQGVDVMAVVNYVESASRDNPVANQDIRKSILDWLHEARLWVAALGQQPARGYVDFPDHWTGQAANSASSKAVSLCRAG